MFWYSGKLASQQGRKAARPLPPGRKGEGKGAGHRYSRKGKCGRGFLGRSRRQSDGGRCKRERVVGELVKGRGRDVDWDLVGVGGADLL